MRDGWAAAPRSLNIKAWPPAHDRTHGDQQQTSLCGVALRRWLFEIHRVNQANVLAERQHSHASASCVHSSRIRDGIQHQLPVTHVGLGPLDLRLPALDSDPIRQQGDALARSFSALERRHEFSKHGRHECGVTRRVLHEQERAGCSLRTHGTLCRPPL